MIFLFLRHSPLYDFVKETHFIKVIWFWVIINTPANLEFSTLVPCFIFNQFVEQIGFFHLFDLSFCHHEKEKQLRSSNQFFQQESRKEWSSSSVKTRQRHALNLFYIVSKWSLFRSICLRIQWRLIFAIVIRCSRPRRWVGYFIYFKFTPVFFS